MKVRVKSAEKTLSLLENPEPTFMSLVTHGANQTPFHSLKAEALPMKNKGAARDGKVTKIHFSKAQFPTEDAVKKQLADLGIEDYEMGEHDDDVFVVKSTEDNSAVKLGKALSTPTTTEGMTLFIAPVEGDAVAVAETAVVTPAARTAKAGGNKVKIVNKDGVVTVVKADGVTPVTCDSVLRFPEATKKYDFWGSYMSESGSLMGVLEDGIEYDGVPPGMDEVMGAAYFTIGNILSADGDPASKQAALAQLGEDLATLSFGLYELFAQATADAENAELSAEKRAAAKKYVDGFNASAERAKAAKVHFGDLPAPAPVVEEPVVEEVVEPAANVDSTPLDAAAIKSLFTEVLAPVTESLKTVTTRLTAVETTAAQAVNTVKEVAGRSPARRSISELATEIVDADAVKKAAAQAEQRQEDVRRMWGIKTDRPVASRSAS